MSNDRTPTSDEVLRRIGRNLIIFHQIESLLKFILKSSDTTHVLPDGASALVETSADGGKSAQQTLGLLVKTYLSDVLVKTGSEKPEPEMPESAQCAFHFTFRSECEDAFVQRMRDDLKLMTEQRNELVHQLYMDNNEFRITYSNIGYGIFPAKFSLTDGKPTSLEIRATDFVESDAYIFVKPGKTGSGN